MIIGHSYVSHKYINKDRKLSSTAYILPIYKLCLHSIFHHFRHCDGSVKRMNISVSHNGHDGVSNHQPHHCLLSRLFRSRSKKTSKLRVTGRWPVNSPHKWPVTRKMFPFDDVIMNFACSSHDILGLRENHHASVVWNWYHWVAIAYLYQPSP